MKNFDRNPFLYVLAFLLIAMNVVCLIGCLLTKEDKNFYQVCDIALTFPLMLVFALTGKSEKDEPNEEPNE